MWQYIMENAHYFYFMYSYKINVLIFDEFWPNIS